MPPTLRRRSTASWQVGSSAARSRGHAFVPEPKGSLPSAQKECQKATLKRSLQTRVGVRQHSQTAGAQMGPRRGPHRGHAARDESRWATQALAARAAPVVAGVVREPRNCIDCSD